MYHVRAIFREFLGHNFVSGLRTIKPKRTFTKKLKKQKPKNFFSLTTQLFSNPGATEVVELFDLYAGAF